MTKAKSVTVLLIFPPEEAVDLDLGLFLAAEIKYVPLQVKPEDVEIDLGGWRLAAGIGCTFEL
jgi:hypothetical protein